MPFFGSRTFIITEIGNNHEGDFGLAKELVELAVDAGADAIKFQTIVPEKLVNRSDEARFATLTKFALTQDQFRELSTLTRARGSLFMSAPFDPESAAFLGEIVDAIKIASGDNTFYPLIAAAAETGKPLVMSTGIADAADVDRAVKVVREAAPSNVADDDIALLHCVSSYPAPMDQANLAAIPTLISRYPAHTIGYSDHTIGIDAACLAVALGARVIEKHFTIDNNYSEFRDHQLSADPATMRELVRRIRETEAAMGDGSLGTAPCEVDMGPAVRRSIVAMTDLTIGHQLTKSDLNWTRPAGGMAPGQEEMLIGKRLNRDIRKGDAFTLDIID